MKNALSERILKTELDLKEIVHIMNGALKESDDVHKGLDAGFRRLLFKQETGEQIYLSVSRFEAFQDRFFSDIKDGMTEVKDALKEMTKENKADHDIIEKRLQKVEAIRGL